MAKQRKNTKTTSDKNARFNAQTDDSVRIDKWLWAARFFKTRSIAKSAIEGGKVHLDGEKVKVSREIRVGMQLTIQQGFEKKTVIVKALSDIRSSAPIAQQLYEETAESLATREKLLEQRKLVNMMYSHHRPNKKERRDQERFHQIYDYGHHSSFENDQFTDEELNRYLNVDDDEFDFEEQDFSGYEEFYDDD